LLYWNGGPKGRRFLFCHELTSAPPLALVWPSRPARTATGARRTETVQNAQPPQIYLDIDASMRRGDMQQAIKLARQALNSGLRHPVIFNLRAYGHELEGRFADACADLEQARALTPRDPVILNALGRCRIGAGRYIDAITACEAALAENPAFAIAYYNKGCAHEQLGELNTASLDYRKALQLEPNIADALARLAGLESRRGQHADARALADRALALNPKHAIAEFAHIVSDLAEDNFKAAEERARKVIREPETTAQARANAQSFLGDALDGQGRFSEAFACYTQANSELRQIFAEQYADRETGRKLAGRLGREFGAISKDAWQGSASPAVPKNTADGLVFLVGFPRAGTTLLGQVLAAHSRVATIVERPVLGMALREFIQTPGGLARLASLPQKDIDRHRQKFWANVELLGIPVRGKILIEQTPLNTLHLPLVAKLFPEAKVVFAVRDPRDVVLSCFRRQFVLNDYVYELLTLDGTACFYDETMKLASRYRECLTLPLIESRNEDLVADFEGRTRMLCDFLDLEWEDTLRHFAGSAAARQIATPSALQVSRGISNEGIGHWRNYAAQLDAVLPVLAPWVERFGYV
jgi:tetratricopeptide (TPR) repeat protein